MLNETQMADLHSYSSKRQTILSAQSKINYRLAIAIADFHIRWESEVIKAAILKYNLIELDANFLAKYPVPEPTPAPTAPTPVPESTPAPTAPPPAPNLEINLEPLPTLSYWETFPPAPAPPLPALIPASMPALSSSARSKQTDTDWIVTPDHFVMYCKIYPQLVTTFNLAALRKAEVCKGLKHAKSSVVMFFRYHVLKNVGFDTTNYVKACLAHAFVIQYPEHAGMFDVVHYVAKSGKSLRCKLADLWKLEGMPVYK